KGQANILIPNPRDLPAVIKELRKYQPSFFPAVNTLFNALVNNSSFLPEILCNRMSSLIYRAMYATT
ncbi:hypothetical protein IAF28_19935, partial [Acinetobacter baumannii]|nr:hypothetical protein [Acinetobacter baumannii]